MTKPNNPDPIAEAESEIASASAKVRAAREIHAELLTRRGQIDADHVALTTERDGLAFSAMTGDPVAKKQLDGLHKRLVGLRDDEASLSAAIATASELVTHAEDELNALQRVDGATKALALLDPLAADGQAADDAAHAFLQAIDRIRSNLRQLRSLGTHPVGEKIMDIDIRRAIEAMFQSELGTELQRPSARRNLSDLCRLWGENVLTQMRRTRTDEAA
jgi:hypothetical protein